MSSFDVSEFSSLWEVQEIWKDKTTIVEINIIKRRIFILKINGNIQPLFIKVSFIFFVKFNSRFVPVQDLPDHPLKPMFFSVGYGCIKKFFTDSLSTHSFRYDYIFQI